MSKRCQIEGSAWVSPIPSPEQTTREAIKSVRVTAVNGHLTDMSVSMLLVEMKRRGVILATH